MRNVYFCLYRGEVVASADEKEQIIFADIGRYQLLKYCIVYCICIEKFWF